MRLTTGVLAAGAIVLTTLVVLGNYVYEILSFVDIPIEKGLLATPERGVVKDSQVPEDSGTVGGKPAASGTPAAKASRDVAPLDVPASTPGVVPPEAVSTPASPPRASLQAAGTAIASPTASVHRKAAGSTQPRTLPCTERMRALGLCTVESTEKKK